LYGTGVCAILPFDVVSAGLSAIPVLQKKQTNKTLGSKTSCEIAYTCSGKWTFNPFITMIELGIKSPLVYLQLLQV